MAENIVNIEATIKNPLSEETRKSRKSLLAFSFIAIAIVHAGFIPVKIESLGIEFTNADQNKILFLLGVVIIYFLISFFIYAIPDLLIVKINKLKNLEILLDKKIKSFENSDKKYEASQALDLAISQEKLRKEYQKLKNMDLISKGIYILRIFSEFILPIIVALYAIYILF